ncbi:hypothetical protein PROFUN_10308 [Planoprotostelium fungivorum]|uniref:Uncharacterized protein n=1 Tax=Planoprotostelium fungivorum TaxID=1890364 RepID=A0A2P6MRS9_9EUKA|nr:hypothetical protein PROFUN_10308 [Planoprotostelium fungivorum]
MSCSKRRRNSDVLDNFYLKGPLHCGRYANHKTLLPLDQTVRPQCKAQSKSREATKPYPVTAWSVIIGSKESQDEDFYEKECRLDLTLIQMNLSPPNQCFWASSALCFGLLRSWKCLILADSKGAPRGCHSGRFAAHSSSGSYQTGHTSFQLLSRQSGQYYLQHTLTTLHDRDKDNPCNKAAFSRAQRDQNSEDDNYYLTLHRNRQMRWAESSVISTGEVYKAEDNVHKIGPRKVKGDIIRGTWFLTFPSNTKN